MDSEAIRQLLVAALIALNGTRDGRLMHCE